MANCYRLAIPPYLATLAAVKPRPERNATRCHSAQRREMSKQTSSCKGWCRLRAVNVRSWHKAEVRRIGNDVGLAPSSGNTTRWLPL